MRFDVYVKDRIFEIEFTNNTVSGDTLCVVCEHIRENYSDNGYFRVRRYITAGKSHCSHEDKFSHTEGWKHALEHALNEDAMYLLISKGKSKIEDKAEYRSVKAAIWKELIDIINGSRPRKLDGQITQISTGLYRSRQEEK